MPKGISGGAEGVQGEPKGSPRAARGGSRRVQGATLEASENGPKNGGGCEWSGGTFWILLGPFWVPFGKCGGYAGPGGGVRGG